MSKQTSPYRIKNSIIRKIELNCFFLKQIFSMKFLFYLSTSQQSWRNNLKDYNCNNKHNLKMEKNYYLWNNLFRNLYCNLSKSFTNTSWNTTFQQLMVGRGVGFSPDLYKRIQKVSSSVPWEEYSHFFSAICYLLWILKG